MKGLFFIKHWFELRGDVQLEALTGFCVGHADQSSDPKCELELRHCVVAETCFVSEKCSNHHSFYFPKLHQVFNNVSIILGECDVDQPPTTELYTSVILNLNQSFLTLVGGRRELGVECVHFPCFLEPVVSTIHQV